VRLLICGGRDWTDRAAIRRLLEQLRPAVVLEGGARGADRLARQEAAALRIKVETYWADWVRHGRRAGLVRNQRMLDEGRPDLVAAFPTERSTGTWHMVGLARRAGVEVRLLGPWSAKERPV
jgi:hypothetical protein